MQAAVLNDSLAVLLELLAASDMTPEEGFCAFAFGEDDGDFDPKHRMAYEQFAAVGVDHLASRLSESAIAELFHKGLDLDGDGFVEGGEWLRALRLSQLAVSRADEPHAVSVSGNAQLQQQRPSAGLQWNDDATAELLAEAHVLSSDGKLSHIEGGGAGIDTVSAERHRHTPMWLDERQHTREGMQAYLHVRGHARVFARAF